MELNSTEQLQKTRSNSSGARLLVFLILIFVLTVVALAVVLAVTVVTINKNATNQGFLATTTVENPKPTSIDEVPCLTKGCILAAARILESINVDVNPCDDFYNFACGNWIQRHVIPEDNAVIGTVSILSEDVSTTIKNVLEASKSAGDTEVIQKARNYYRSCMNQDRIEQLGLTFIQTYMNTFGGWPVMGNSLGGNWQENNYTLNKLLLNARKDTKSPPLIEIGVRQDVKNPSKSIIYIDQPTLEMPSRDYYLKGSNDTTLMAFRTMWKDLAIELGAESQTADKDANDVVDLQTDIANITVPMEDRRDLESLNNKMTIGDLENNFTGIEWKVLVQETFNMVGISVTDSEPVIVLVPKYFSKLGQVIAKYNKRTMANYIIGSRILDKTFLLPKRINEIREKYQQVLFGTTTQSSRWETCTSLVKDAMPEVVGRLFVMASFKKEAKADVLDLIEHLRITFKGMIDKVDWMEFQTKILAKEKVDYMEPRIGYPEMVYDDIDLNKMYENVTIDIDDPLRNFISIYDDKVTQSLQEIRKPFDRSKWDMSPAEVNAYYNPGTNQITFLAAILQPPLYVNDQPAYLNFGGIGNIIGHEITHGFDDQGRLYDKEGNMKSWWTNTDVQKFKERAQCIIDQYSNFTVTGTNGKTLNGINTLGENIADNGGISESFQAYQSWLFTKRAGKAEAKLPGLPFTPNQLFFVNVAQVLCENIRDEAKLQLILTDSHSISMYRVIGPMQNLYDFSKAWNCTSGSFMNPTKKCAVW